MKSGVGKHVLVFLGVVIVGAVSPMAAGHPMQVISGTISFADDELLLAITLDSHRLAHEVLPGAAPSSFEDVASALLRSIDVKASACAPLAGKITIDESHGTAERRVSLPAGTDFVTLRHLPGHELAGIHRQFQLRRVGGKFETSEFRLTSRGNVMAIGRGDLARFAAELAPLVRILIQEKGGQAGIAPGDASVRKVVAEVEYPFVTLCELGAISGSRADGFKPSQWERMRTTAEAWFRQAWRCEGQSDSVPNGVKTEAQLLSGAAIDTGASDCIEPHAVRVRFRATLSFPRGQGQAQPHVRHWTWDGFGPHVLQVPLLIVDNGHDALVGSLRPGHGEFSISSDDVRIGK